MGLICWSASDNDLADRDDRVSENGDTEPRRAIRPAALL
jgi:hypothetical protein